MKRVGRVVPEWLNFEIKRVFLSLDSILFRPMLLHFGALHLEEFSPERTTCISTR